MKFLHSVTDTQGQEIESFCTNSNSPKNSMKILRDIKSGVYKIWTRSDWSFEIV